MKAVALALLTGALAGRVAVADISVTDARRIAEQAAGWDLSDAEEHVEEIPLGEGREPIRVVRFTLGDPGPAARSCTVNLTQGVFKGFLLPSPATPSGDESVPPDAALSAARASASQALGEEAETLEWTVEDSGRDLYMVKGNGPMAGDPPRDGLTATCWIKVARATGEVVSYHQTIPVSREPMPLAVARDAAVAAACAASGYDGDPVGEPTLFQGGGGATWYVVLPADTGQVTYVIDAASGDVSTLERDVSYRARPDHARRVVPPRTPPAAVSPDAPSHPAFPWPLAAGAALLLAAGLGLVLLRRRR